jgi:UDP-N-acetylglucosamine 2-epimerase (non-hydrolysing)
MDGVQLTKRGGPMDSYRDRQYLPRRMAAAIGGVAGGLRADPTVREEGAPLLVASSRSAVVRLAPLLAALHASEVRAEVAGLVDGLGRYAPPTLECSGRAPAEVARAVEAAIERHRPGFVVLAGDSDAAVESAIAAARRGVPIARLGAGLRRGDRDVHQEVNRIVLDAMADRLYSDGEDATRRLLDEGVAAERVRQVGSTVADVVLRWREPAEARGLWRRFDLEPYEYALVALQDDSARLGEVMRLLGARMPVIACAAHARLGAGVTGPLGYVDFLSLVARAGAVVTDSANVQEEASVLGVRCYTLRHASEATMTLTEGTNLLLGEDLGELAYVAPRPPGEAPGPIKAWDGAAARRVSADLRLLRLA